MNFYKKSKKSLGQNFLVDQNIIKKIVNIGNIENSKIIYEIGSGYGNLTKEILKRKPKKIYAIEKDKHLSNHLNETFKNNSNIKIINGDILSIIKKKIKDKNVIVFGNLPYNISTQILASLVLTSVWPPWYKTLIFMFQKEVADRIIAKTHTKEFSRLTVLSNWRLEIKKHFNVSKNCFYPKPNVDSTVLSFKPKKNNFILKNPKNLENITRLFFSNRRKMINKIFLKLFNNKTDIADELNLKLSQRPENLSCEMYYKIAMKYEELFR
jgi:16S rRNA (adenine1518-N6/adenine1519-N6)-dimethyltransferase